MAALFQEMTSLARALQGVRDPAALAGLAGRVGELLRALEDLIQTVELFWASLLSQLLALQLWFEHMLRSMPRVEPQPVRVHWPEAWLLPTVGGAPRVGLSPGFELRPSGQARPPIAVGVPAGRAGPDALRVNLERDAHRVEMDESVRAVSRTFRGSNDEHGGDARGVCAPI